MMPQEKEAYNLMYISESSPAATAGSPRHSQQAQLQIRLVRPRRHPYSSQQGLMTTQGTDKHKRMKQAQELRLSLRLSK